MKRFSTLLRSKGSKNEASTSNTISESDNVSAESPEGNAARAVRLFCESGSTNNRDEEVLHLPTIVDAAESSPAAAAACAAQIRSFLQKDYTSKPHVQYNAVMLIRILSDNPGASFTRNFDEKFVKSVKTTLRSGQDPSVQQILRETLDNMAINLSHDAGLQGLLKMWNKEKGYASPYTNGYGVPPPVPTRDGVMAGAPPMVHNNSHGSRHNRNQLPSQPELASRIEEARNTAKILIQFLQTTPSEEVSSNELIREFSERCQSAQRSMQTFINCENPPPDDDTLQTLIETNEQLSLANSRYQRAVLAARRALGVSPPISTEPRSASTTAPALNNGVLAPIPVRNGFGSQQNGTRYIAPAPAAPAQQPYVPPVSTSQQQPSTQTQTRVEDDEDDLYDSPVAARAPVSDPFADPTDHPSPLLHSEISAAPHDNSYADVSPQQTHHPRPAPGPWHTSTVTTSFLGRQANAADGLTMHAPGTAELDGNSKIGRTDAERGTQPQTNFTVNHA